MRGDAIIDGSCDVFICVAFVCGECILLFVVDVLSGDGPLSMSSYGMLSM